jgi:hypothetical protein
LLTILTAPPGLARWRKTTTALPALSLLVALVTPSSGNEELLSAGASFVEALDPL